jgi:hypothetical protein
MRFWPLSEHEVHDAHTSFLFWLLPFCCPQLGRSFCVLGSMTAALIDANGVMLLLDFFHAVPKCSDTSGPTYCLAHPGWQFGA